MSDPKTVPLPQQKSNDAGSGEQQCAQDAVSCEAIRERAYYKWEAAGCPCSDGVEYWLQAEAELIAETPPSGEASET